MKFHFKTFTALIFTLFLLPSFVLAEGDITVKTVTTYEEKRVPKLVTEDDGYTWYDYIIEYVKLEFDVYSNSEYSWLDNGDGTAKIIEYLGNSEDITIPDTLNNLLVKEIHDGLDINYPVVDDEYGEYLHFDEENSYLLFDNKNVKNVTLPGNFEVLGAYAFRGVNLENLTVLNSRLLVEMYSSNTVMGIDDSTVINTCENSNFNFQVGNGNDLNNNNLTSADGCTYNEPDKVKQNNFFGVSFNLNADDLGEESEGQVYELIYSIREGNFNSGFVVDRVKMGSDGTATLRVSGHPNRHRLNGYYSIRVIEETEKNIPEVSKINQIKSLVTLSDFGEPNWLDKLLQNSELDSGSKVGKYIVTDMYVDLLYYENHS